MDICINNNVFVIGAVLVGIGFILLSVAITKLLSNK